MAGLYREVTQELLHEYFSYDGAYLVRKIDSGPAKAGETAGYLCPSSGYWRITFLSRSHSAHRLIWMYVYGRWPSGVIDHANRVRHDNRIKNLRDADYFLNARNRCETKRSLSGHIGVSPRRGRFRASIGHKGKTIVLGTFNTMPEAIAARRLGELCYWDKMSWE